MSALAIGFVALCLLWVPVAEAVQDMLAGRKPDAVVDLGTREGVELVKGEWRYSDTRIIEVDFKAPGQDGQPTGKPIKAYDYTPHAGGAGFDDSKWEVLDPTTLSQRRSTGRLAFNWYRIKITIPERIGKFDPTGSIVVFETSVDDYAEIWVDGELPRAPGQSGGSVIKGWNATNRLVIGRDIKPGQKIQLAIFGINGPISNPPTNYIWMRFAKLEFHKVKNAPIAVTPQEVNVKVIRLDPAIDAIVPPNPKIFKLAEGFKFTEGPVWVSGGYLLLSDPSRNRIYKYSNGKLSVLGEKNRNLGRDYSRSGSDGKTLDRQGNLYVIKAGLLSVTSRDGKHLGDIIAPKPINSITWGDEDGRTLYITASTTLYRMQLNIPGVRP